MREPEDRAPLDSHPEISEVGSLLRKIARIYVEAATFFCQQMQLAPDEPSTRARESEPVHGEYLLMWPADQVGRWALGRLVEHEPETAQALWERLKAVEMLHNRGRNSSTRAGRCSSTGT